MPEAGHRSKRYSGKLGSSRGHPPNGNFPSVRRNIPVQVVALLQSAAFSFNRGVLSNDNSTFRTFSLAGLLILLILMSSTEYDFQEIIYAFFKYSASPVYWEDVAVNIGCVVLNSLNCKLLQNFECPHGCIQCFVSILSM